MRDSTAHRFLTRLLLAAAVRSADAATGLLFPSNGVETGRFLFSGSNPNPFHPATYIWRVKPSQQNGYYTTRPATAAAADEIGRSVAYKNEEFMKKWIKCEK
jgi:hypothetical protein